MFLYGVEKKLLFIGSVIIIIIIIMGLSETVEEIARECGLSLLMLCNLIWVFVLDKQSLGMEI